MARIEYPSIKDAAAEVLRDVAAERLVKEAEQRLLRTAECPPTELGEDLCKLAAALRQVDDDNPQITYGDLQNFVTRCSR
jgi:hypothetical protein